jgi:NADPH2:quinone reductase
MNDKNIFGKIKSALAFGFYHPVMLMMPSKAIIGINMLKVADEHPETLQRCLQAVVHFTEQGIFTPLIGKVFPATEIAVAHHYLETRQSMGKIAVVW